jgi:hypothetical protein
MRFRILVLVAGVAIASGMVLGATVPSGAQVVATCTATTATFVQAVGSSSAPILVPINLPVSECTLPHHVQVIIPAFRVVGAQPASIIVPSGLPVTSCSVSAALPAASTTSSVQVITVSGSTVTVLSPVTVVAPPLVTCF